MTTSTPAPTNRILDRAAFVELVDNAERDPKVEWVWTALAHDEALRAYGEEMRLAAIKWRAEAVRRRAALERIIGAWDEFIDEDVVDVMADAIGAARAVLGRAEP